MLNLRVLGSKDHLTSLVLVKAHLNDKMISVEDVTIYTEMILSEVDIHKLDVNFLRFVL